jgi:hypothetical protein
LNIGTFYLGPEFETGWISANRGVRKITLKSEYKRVKIHELAKEVFENYLKDAKSKPHQPFIELQECGNKIHSLISEIEADRDTEMQATYFDAVYKLNISFIFT